MKDSGKKVTVWGLGKTGIDSALFLHRKGFEVYAWDQMSSPELSNRIKPLLSEGICTETGVSESERLLESDWILISPGIKPSTPAYQAVLTRRIPVYSEIEVASWFCPSSNIIAVTGSAGKTTVTTLLSQVFRKAGHTVITCGNIGNPWINELEKIHPGDYVVMELSSFQLFHCQDFRPKVGILLNISPNHLDWHKDMVEYVDAKLNMFRNQKADDFALIRSEDEEKFFCGFFFNAQKIYLDRFQSQMDTSLPQPNPNERVISIVAERFGIRPEVTEQVLRDFQGIEHRLERVETVEGVTFVNDSKCTTPLSLSWGLQKYRPGSIILIAGGRAKSKDFPTLRPLLSERVKQAVLIGESRGSIGEAWRGACPLSEAEDLKSAVRQAFHAAAAGDVVLLSPACASFDMFKNYEDRGKIFKEIVRDLHHEVAGKAAASGAAGPSYGG
jgi:UDP-N-acetylmuramoylalanine--D-glutamate ligase